MNAHIPALALDGVSLKREFATAKRVEASFGATLRKVAAHVLDIIRGFDPTDPVQLAYLRMSLASYAEAIRPWAGAVASRMVAEVAARDRAAWIKVTTRMGLNLQRDLVAAPLDHVMTQLAETQASLITSIPPDAADRVHQWTQAALSEGTRPASIAARIMSEIGDVTKARATMIARTECARTATTLTQARSEWVGVTHYRWLAVMDADTRSDHRELHGRVFAWSDPPISDKRSGARAAPGCIWNCRCVAIPLIDGM